MSHRYSFLNSEVPDKEEVKQKTTNPATSELQERLEQAGVMDLWQRFRQQTPQCRYGLSGTCCNRCLWGPCRVDNNKKQGICGADADLIIAGNLLRYLAAGCTAHGTHALQVAETLLAYAADTLPYSPLGEERLAELARLQGIEPQDASLSEQAKAAGQLLLETVKGNGKSNIFNSDDPEAEIQDTALRRVIKNYAPAERVELWENLGIMPSSNNEEVFEALHLTTLGSCSDYRSLLKQELKTALAYAYGALMPACAGQEALYGTPRPGQAPVEVNYGVLQSDAVNILISGHSPVLAESLVAAVQKPEIKERVEAAGARKIVLAGSCCTGNSLLSRHGVPSVANIMALELVLATGAVDGMVLDMQCTIPGLKTVADCFGGNIITTYEGNRFVGDYHRPLSFNKPHQVAEEIIELAIANFARRSSQNTYIPAETTRAMAGWSTDSFFNALGGGENLLEYMRESKIKGIVSICGCNSPKTLYEFDQVHLARELLKRGILVFTSGCASYALINAGLAVSEAAENAAEGLRDICYKHGIPPVLPIGSCTDNFRLLQIYMRLSQLAGLCPSQMPFCHSGPAPGSEKNVGQGLTFLLHGISVHQGFPGGIPVPLPQPVENQQHVDDLELTATSVAKYFAREAHEELGAGIYLEPYPHLAAGTIQMHLHRKRLQLNWKG